MAVHKSRRSILSLKSWLFTPATKADRFGRAAEVHADALIIDLEDAVALSDKQRARTAALQYLEQPAEGVAVRASNQCPCNSGGNRRLALASRIFSCSGLHHSAEVRFPGVRQHGAITARSRCERSRGHRSHRIRKRSRGATRHCEE